MTIPYHNTSNRTYSMKAHIVLVIKYRKCLLQNEINVEMKNIINEWAKHWEITVEACESDLHHIHILIDYSFRLRLDKVVDSLKTFSTKKIWKTFDSELSRVFWKERTFWSDGAFICSTGGASTEVIKNYINNQKH